MDREVEVRHLGEADTHIADSERRIMKQIAILEELHREGRDTKVAEKMLATFRSALETMHAHRALIVDAIRSIDAGLI